MTTLRRESDGEGHYGSRVESIDPDTGDVELVAGPVVGKMFKVGTATAGLFSTRDWWRTNVVTEILEETDSCVRFKTASGSIYVFDR